MKVKWKILLTSMTMWLIGEIYLGLLGIDDFSDYNQFLQDRINLILVVANSSRFNNATM